MKPEPILNHTFVVALMLLITLVIVTQGCSTRYVVQKCNLPEHHKPELNAMETNEDFIEFLKLLLQEYDLLLSDYEACRE